MSGEEVQLVEVQFFDWIKVYAAKALPTGVMGVKPELRRDYLADSVVASLRAFVLGKKGDSASHTEGVRVPNFPRWVPDWLRRRWTIVREVTVNVEPAVIYPHSTNVPEHFGRPVEVITSKTVQWADGDDSFLVPVR